MAVNPADRTAHSTSAASPPPNAFASVGLAVAVAVLWMITLSGGGSGPTTLLTLVLVVVGLPFSIRYGLRALQGIDSHKSGSPSGRGFRKVVVVLALLINGWVLLMVAGYALIVAFSLLNGGPIVAAR